ncbi:MAG TPA: hypothetical protein VGC88_12075, partial [Terriglobales bacterium]
MSGLATTQAADPSALARSIAQSIEEFIAASPSPAVVEEGVLAFDFAEAKYALNTEHGRCLLHLWSPERNVVRRVLSLEHRASALRLTVQRMGHLKPSKLDIVANRERRSPAAQKLGREQYQRVLERVMQRAFPDWKLEPFSNRPELSKSFGPVCARGIMRRGRTAWACLGLSSDEPQATIDGALTIGILWLDYLREQHAAEFALRGLRLILPRGSSHVARMRAGHLNHALAQFEIWELDEHTEELVQKDALDRGNIATRLVRCMDGNRVRDRFAASITRMREMISKFDTVAVSSGELSFRLHGLEFARANGSLSGNTLAVSEQITFGVGPNTTTLTQENKPLFLDILARVANSRGSEYQPRNPLWRMQPERWLEAIVAADVQALDNELSPTHVYSQVPAFSASDRAMIDVLCATRNGRLAVIELKADEDIHLPLQGLDYWARVRYHHQRNEFAQYGYFAGRQISPEPPLLILV